MQKMVEIQGKVDKSNTVAGDFESTSNTVRLSGQK